VGTIPTKHRQHVMKLKGHGGESKKTSFLASWRHTLEMPLRRMRMIGLKHSITLERAFGIVRLDDFTYFHFSEK
jgi:hypothetical protein